MIYCPGARQPDSKLKVVANTAASPGGSSRLLKDSVATYVSYVEQQGNQLVLSTVALCGAIDAGNLALSQQLYAQAQADYQRIEPVAENLGSLNTEMDGQINNPVTDPANLQGLHRIEQLLWANDGLVAAPSACRALEELEQTLVAALRTTPYSPMEMACGAGDVVNDVTTLMVSGQAESYSNTELGALQANLEGAGEIVALFTPYLRADDPKLLRLITSRQRSLENAMKSVQSDPGYDDSGYLEYTAVAPVQWRTISARSQALAESR
jgi:iron uptake system component EfeO